MAQIAIYIVQHKPYRFLADPAYIPLQVGSGERFCALRDDQGENIAEKNAAFCELTALYWIWKHDSAEIVGLVHYRRFFAAPGCRRDPWSRVLTGDALLKKMERACLILPKKRHYVIETNYSQYAHAHHERDLLLTKQVISELCPDYLEAFDAVMGRRSGHRFNMLVARREVLDRYCCWLFPILFELEKRADTSSYDAYNRRVIGFVAERLLDVWLYREELPIEELPVVNVEGENWIGKGMRFCARKIKGMFQRNGGDPICSIR